MTNSFRSIRATSMVAFLAFASPGVAFAEFPPLWGKLPPGPHGISFRPPTITIY
jgi:hypothetical protein